MSATQTTTNLGLPQFQSNDIPTWGDINSAFALLDALAGSIATKYDSTATYSQGDIVQYEGALYKAKADISVAEEFTPAHWDAFVVSSQLESTELTNFVKVDLTSGSGITSNEYAHLTIQQ